MLWTRRLSPIAEAVGRLCRPAPLRVTAALVTSLLLVTGSSALAGGGCNKKCGSASAPNVAISTPSAGADVASPLQVAGSASSSSRTITSVGVSVDGGVWHTASGTTSWTASVDAAQLAPGTHVLSARATDSSGKSTSVSENVVVADTAAPSVTMTTPSAGTTVGGSVTLTGSAADDVAVSRVDVSVDSGAWRSATGTTTWSAVVDTSSLSDGLHTFFARATDAAGNTATTSVAVTVKNTVLDSTPPTITFAAPKSGSTVSGVVTVSGSASDNVGLSALDVQVDGGAWQAASGKASWSYAWDTAAVADGPHTVVAKATDTSGNTTTASLTITVLNSSTAAPSTQGTWVSPEGVTINVDSVGSWTIAQVYSILKANALDLNVVGPTLTINVQDQYTSQTQTSATYYGGRYTGVKSTMWLQGVSSNFATRPDDTLAHEYGHAWSNYWYYMAHQADWSSYENARWTTSDGSLTLLTDTRTGTTYSWTIREIIADDYRLLFGSSLAVSERPSHLNPDIPDPHNVPGSATFLLNSWRTP
jgi:Bacterial Ig domain